MFYWVFEGQDTSLGLGLISYIGIFLTHTYHHTLETAAISCYICSSYGGLWGCLDPFDYQPIVRKNCDFEPWVRGPPYPVFCEKRTDIVDGQYITTRRCSQETWEDIKGYQSVRDGHIPCIRRGRKETCL